MEVNKGIAILLYAILLKLCIKEITITPFIIGFMGLYIAIYYKKRPNGD